MSTYGLGHLTDGTRNLRSLRRSPSRKVHGGGRAAAFRPRPLFPPRSLVPRTYAAMRSRQGHRSGADRPSGSAW